ncbi:MAG: DUF1853 family protein, partial [Halomonas sp.]|nr:DUF1853 family protein [Halomonas sp.]
RRQDWLNALTRAPRTLEACAGPKLAGRLGLYHEALWHFLLAHAPGTRLLAHNLPVRNGRRTLGELDLLYALHGDSSPVHLELAVKFYLGLPQGPGPADSQARWVGPGSIDSLAIKRQRTLTRQLPLSRSAQARAALAPYTAQAPAVRLAMPGVLFRPWQPADTELPLPCEASPRALKGLWLPRSRWAEFCHCAGVEGWRGGLLDKPHWLAPPSDATLHELTNVARLLDESFARRSTPRQLALKRPDGAWLRLFVVDDDWPRATPLPPRPTMA